MNKAHKLAGIIKVPHWRLAFINHNVAASVEHASALRSLGSINTVIDIGANRGQFALAARHSFSKALIYSFEPLPKPAAVFRSLFKGDLRVQLHQTAIGPSLGSATMHISARDHSSSLLPITSSQEKYFPGTEEIGTKKINLAPLSAYLNPEDIRAPALLKLDVQGFELDSLKGCSTLLEHFAWVYVECSFMELYAGQSLADDIIAWLHQRGYLLRGIYNTSYSGDGCAVQADFLFAQREAQQVE